MRYWKRGLICGTMDDNGHVPDSIEVAKVVYDVYVESVVVEQKPKSDIDKVVEYAIEQGWIQ